MNSLRRRLAFIAGACNNSPDTSNSLPPTPPEKIDRPEKSGRRRQISACPGHRPPGRRQQSRRQAVAKPAMHVSARNSLSQPLHWFKLHFPIATIGARARRFRPIDPSLPSDHKKRIRVPPYAIPTAWAPFSLPLRPRKALGSETDRAPSARRRQRHGRGLPGQDHYCPGDVGLSFNKRLI